MSANITSMLLLYCGGILYARFLAPKFFGQFSFAMSILSLLLMMNGGGVSVGLLQFGSKYINKVSEYLCYSVSYGLKVNLFYSLLMIIGSFFYPLRFGGQIFFLSFIPLIFLRLPFDILISYFRAVQNIKYLSVLLLINSCCIIIFALLGIFNFGLYGLVYGIYIGYIISLSIIFFYGRGYIKSVLIPELFYPKKNMSHFIKFTWQSSFSNIMSQTLYLIDIFVIGIILKSAFEVALFKVGSMIPFAINSIMAVVMGYFYPIIVSHTSSIINLRGFYLKLLLGTLFFSFLIFVFLSVYSSNIIHTLYGMKYARSIEVLRILTYGVLVVLPFRVLTGNFISALGRADVNLKLSLITFILNIALSPIMIYFYGIIGAAYGVLIMYAVSSTLASLWFIRHIFFAKIVDQPQKAYV